MPVVPITSDEQYETAIAVLTEVGGTYQGIGPVEDAKLLVSNRQYRALVAAQAVTPRNEKESGQKARQAK